MSAQIAAYGRLVADPRVIETRSGKAMTAARSAAVTSLQLQANEPSHQVADGCPGVAGFRTSSELDIFVLQTNSGFPPTTHAKNDYRDSSRASHQHRNGVEHCYPI